MSEINQDRYRLLVKICQLYYEEDLNQLDIAKRLGISRPHVSRMLTAAKNEGIVNISINNPFSTEQELEKLFIKTFSIQDALIVDSSETDPIKLHAQLGRTSAALIESVLRDGDIVGIMAGRTIASAAEKLDYFEREGLQFVPLVGGWGSEGTSWHANSNALAFANKLKSKCWILHAPAVVASEETGALLRREPAIDQVLQLAQQSRVAVISIGEVSEQATMVRSGNFSLSDIAAVEERGAVASLCASFLDSSGREIEVPEKNRFIGLTASELRVIPKVIGIAGGSQKVEAITAALRGKWMDILVTDAATARAILDFHRSNEAK
ncbi:winged helix-turn-helix transcriptional regulator [Paenibacillus sp. LMG 31456]|uniref:Winged helix-turn-helix transcriptional regulator n=1 Tax=Paenibacillus foliorum TaxID=2654974 RepID=A0A972GY59_9BACL|nr:sugar-binding transcriptional regulator [Paenibacillus foliorum]NOU98285.1 winged helix-turn-helix transcriptional regulator [Paenibacillus foliorum]